MFIDRAGAKVGLIEQHSRNSKASLSFVAEQVRHRDAVCSVMQSACQRVCRRSWSHWRLKAQRLSLGLLRLL